MKFILKNSRFFKDVLTLMTGVMSAQLIAIFSFPLLTRLYSPEELGLVAFFLGIWAILVGFFTGRYELAIVLPKSDQEANNIVSLATFLSILVCIVSSLFIFAFYAYFETYLTNPQIREWLCFIPAIVFLLSLTHIITYVGTRFRAYKKVAAISVLQQFIYVCFALLFGVLGFTKGGLITSRFLTYGTILFFILWFFLKEIKNIIKDISVKKMVKGFFQYKQFLCFNVPYNALENLSKEFIIFVFVAFGFSQSAGLYSLARSVLYLPIAFLIATLGQAFYKEAVVKKGSVELEKVVNFLNDSLIIFSVPVFSFFVIWAPEIFSFCFGETWREAGLYASIFAPSAFFYLFTSWAVKLFEVYRKQHISLSIQIIFDFIVISSLWTLMVFNYSIITCIALYAIFNSLYHVIYIVVIFKITNFNFSSLFDKLIKSLVLLTLSIAFYLPCFVFSSVLVQFISGVSVLLCYYLAVLYLNTKPLQNVNLKFLIIQQG